MKISLFLKKEKEMKKGEAKEKKINHIK